MTPRGDSDSRYSYKINQQANYISLPLTNQQTPVMADTGASGHYIRPSDPHTKTGILRTPINVGLPNGTILQSNKETCLLNLKQLPIAAREAHTIPGLTHSSFISIRILCDAGCTAEFDHNKVVVKHNNKTILEGPRDNQTGLWRIPMDPSPTKHPAAKIQHCNNAYRTQSIPDFVKFLHATAFSPTKATWLKAIKQGFYQSWPGLTHAAAGKYFPTSMDMHKGHMDQSRKNVRSTKKEPIESETTPTQNVNNEPTHLTFATIEDTGNIYTDQTGRFPVTSSQGHKYILIMYDYDSNAILTEPIKSRNGGEILRAYKKLFEYLQPQGCKPRTHWLDNEASNALKEYNTQRDVTYQLVPPNMHRRNAAERAIRTWKTILPLDYVAPTKPSHCTRGHI
jgi:hypothetical protein